MSRKRSKKVVKRSQKRTSPLVWAWCWFIGAVIGLYASFNDWMNQELKVWHLIVSLTVIAWFMQGQFASAMREVSAIRREVEEQQAAQTQMIVAGFRVFGVDIKDLVRD